MLNFLSYDSVRHFPKRQTSGNIDAVKNSDSTQTLLLEKSKMFKPAIWDNAQADHTSAFLKESFHLVYLAWEQLYETER